MTYDQLVTLIAIVEYGSFKAASEQLHKSQPSLSVSMKKLEEEFSINIFNREDYRPKLTDHGKVFYQKALQAISSFKDLENLGTELGAGLEAEIRISLDALVPIENLKAVLHDFFKNSSTTDLNINTDVLGGAFEKIINREVDLAICPHFEESPHLERFLFQKIKLIPVASRELLEGLDSSADIMNRFPQIIVKGTGTNAGLSHGVLDETKKWYVSDGTMKEDLIKLGLGWGRLPSCRIENFLKTGELQKISIKGLDTTELSLYITRNNQAPMGPKLKELWEKLKGCAVDEE